MGFEVNALMNGRGIKFFQIVVLGTLFILIAAVSSVHADIFMYIDENGVMHFTNAPTSNEYDYKVYIKERTAVSRNFRSTNKYDHFITDAAEQTGVDRHGFDADYAGKLQNAESRKSL
jgi:hypothetical protein